MIDALKDNIRFEQKLGRSLKMQIIESSHFIKFTKEQIADMALKSESAKRDRQELFRDLATFEFNFSKKD